MHRHYDTIYLDWEEPAEPNGILTGYILKYQTCKCTSLLITCLKALEAQIMLHFLFVFVVWYPNVLCFWKKSIKLSMSEFIWSKIQSNSNTVKSYYTLK